MAMAGASAPDRKADAVARARVAALLDRLARVDLQVVVVSPPDGTRIAARDRARAAAIVAGRAALLDESTAAARDVAMKGFARSGFSGTWAATDMAVSVATARDRAAVAAAFDEAATAAVAEDLVDDETLDALRSTSNQLVGMTGLPSPGALSSFASPATLARRGTFQAAIATMFVFFLAAVALSGAYGIGIGFLALAVGLGIMWLRGRRPPDR